MKTTVTEVNETMTITTDSPVTISDSITQSTNTNSQLISIKPCDFECGCYVKQNKFWCNHCVNAYEVIESIVYHNPNIDLGSYLLICMKQLRGKIDGETCNKILNLLLRDK